MNFYRLQVLFLPVFFLPLISSAQDESRTSLGISGCAASESRAAATADGGITFVGCEGPTGVFYSRDRGASWTFAGVKGSAYEAGAGRTVVLTESAAFMSGASGMITTPLPSTTTEAWTPSWAPAPGAISFVPHLRGGRFIVGYTEGTPALLQTYDTVESGIVDEEQIPGGIPGWKFRVEALTEDGSLIASFGAKYSTATETALYRISVDSASGTITGPWQKTVLMNNGEPVAPGLPAPYSTLDGAFRIENLAISPQGRIYAALTMKSHSENQPIYWSDDFGASFHEELFSGLTVPESLSHAFSRMNAAAFAGDNQLIENVFSPDRGVTWSDLSSDLPLSWRTEQNISLNPGVVFLEPSARWALLKTNAGFARVASSTGRLDLEPREWSIPGEFQAIPLEAIAKDYHNPNDAVVATSSGFSITKSYLNEHPAWGENYCPLDDCFGGRVVAPDPVSSGVFFFGGDPWIVRVALTPEGKPDKTTYKYLNRDQLISSEWGRVFYGRLYTNPAALPNSLVVTLNAGVSPAKGGIFFVDLTKPMCEGDVPSSHEEPCGAELARKAQLSSDGAAVDIPMREFIAVSSQIMFAVSGIKHLDYKDMPERNVMGLYRSDDGGLSFTRLTDLELDAAQGWRVVDFAYDSNSDVLYVLKVKGELPTQEGNLAILRNAGAGNLIWEIAALTGSSFDRALTAIAVDPLLGAILVGGSEKSVAKVWSSLDGGATWGTLSTGLESEEVNFLSVDEVIEGANIRISSKPRYVQGSSTGLYSLASTVLPAAQCRLRLEEACKPAVRKGTSCTFTAKIRPNTGESKSSFRLMRRAKADAPWKAVGNTRTTNNKGNALVKAKIKRTGTYTLQSEVFSCSSNRVRVKVRRN